MPKTEYEFINFNFLKKTFALFSKQKSNHKVIKFQGIFY